MNSIISDVRRALRTGKYEQTDGGAIRIGGSQTFIGGVFSAAYAAPGDGFGERVTGYNRVVNEGLVKLLGLLGGHVTSAPLYLAPFTGNVAPAADWAGTNFASLATEFTDYTSSTRLPWTTTAPTTPALANSASLAAATLTFSGSGPYTIRGCGLLEGSAKGGTTGKLVAASRFGADLTGMTAGGKLALEYVLSAIDEGDA